ncbi:class I SAM-dependent methyltransferase, partial [Bacteroidota bacterium]
MKKYIIIVILLFAGFINNIAQENLKVLEPESSNEARLNRLQPPEDVMNAIGIKQGMVVAEIGAGRGRYVVQLAVRVGKNGKVYAEDIDKAALNHLKARCEKGNLKNVETIIGNTDNPKLPKGKMDLIFIISSYHHFEDPVTLMKNARESLKSGGHVAIGEWNTQSGTSPEKLESQMKSAGYKLERIEKLLEKNDMLIYIF